jgi:hypothetical protein
VYPSCVTPPFLERGESDDLNEDLDEDEDVDDYAI